MARIAASSFARTCFLAVVFSSKALPDESCLWPNDPFFGHCDDAAAPACATPSFENPHPAYPPIPDGQLLSLSTESQDTLCTATANSLTGIMTVTSADYSGTCSKVATGGSIKPWTVFLAGSRKIIGFKLNCISWPNVTVIDGPPKVTRHCETVDALYASEQNGVVTFSDNIDTTPFVGFSISPSDSSANGFALGYNSNTLNIRTNSTIGASNTLPKRHDPYSKKYAYQALLNGINTYLYPTYCVQACTVVPEDTVYPTSDSVTVFYNAEQCLPNESPKVRACVKFKILDNDDQAEDCLAEKTHNDTKGKFTITGAESRS